VGVFFLHHLLDGPLASQLSTRAAADLARYRPELLVISKKAVATTAPAPAWLTQDYLPLPIDLQRDTHTLLARRGGKLEMRLAAQTRHQANSVNKRPDAPLPSLPARYYGMCSDETVAFPLTLKRTACLECSGERKTARIHLASNIYGLS
jgi:hypothetical protein